MTTLEIFINQFDSENTRKTYSIAINQMLDYIGKNETEIEQIDLTAWKNSLKDLKQATQDTKIRAINSYVGFLNENNINPNLTILKSVRVNHSKQDHDALTHEQSIELMRMTTNKRERAILAVFLNTGLRANELINIQLEDYLSGEDIVIYGKGDKYNVVRLSDKTRAIIDEYLAVRKDSKYENLFISDQCTPMNNQCMNRTINKLVNRFGIEDRHITCHSMRRAVITKVVEEHGIYVAQKVANHSSISTTMLYVKENRAKTLDVMANML